MKILFNGYHEVIKGKGGQVRGGPQNFTRQLVKYLQESGHTFVGLVPRSNKAYADFYEVQRHTEKGGSWLTVTTQFNIINILNSDKLDISPLTKRGVRILSDVISEESPDIVLLNGFSLLNWYILKAAHVAKIPVVVSHHGLWFKEVSEFTSHIKKNTIAITRRMEKDITKLASHEFFLNEFSLEEFEKEFGKIKTSKRSVVPISYNPIFLNKNIPRKKINKPLRIGFVGRWDPIKKPEVFYQIAKEAKRQGRNWEFHAITTINKSKPLLGVRSKFKKLINIIPNLEPKQLKKFYGQMDIMILPSRFDVSPTVVAEAALQGRGTIISKNVGWVNSYSKLGMEEWIDNFSDIKAVIDKIATLAFCPIPDKFVKYVQEEHSTNAVMKRQLKILRSLIKVKK